MKRTLIFVVLLALVASQAAFGQSTLRRIVNNLEVDIWTDRDDGSSYQEGDAITIYFRASQDCYVTIYDLDTRGNINLIYPEQPDMNNFIVGDEIYMIPDRSEDYELEVTGPPGNEHIQMVASMQPFDVPEWWEPISVVDDGWPFSYDDDDEQFLDQVNQTFFPYDHAAYDRVSFYVSPKYYYKRAEVDCAGDCGVVYVDYPTGCEVYVDGIYWGVAPLWIPSIYLGRHRMSVYWGTFIVYNDWFTVYDYEPCYVYTRPHYLYSYYYDHWSRPYHWGHRNGPSPIKYKPRTYYSGGKLETRSGYTIVDNDNMRYKKSKVYSTAKIDRIKTYKSKYGYDKATKTYTTVKRKPISTFDTKVKTYTTPSVKKGDDGKGSATVDRKPAAGSAGSKGSVVPSSRSGGDKKKDTSGDKKSTIKRKSTSASKAYETWRKAVGAKSVKPKSSSGSKSSTNSKSATVKSSPTKSSSGSKSGQKSSAPKTKSSSSSVKKSSGSKSSPSSSGAVKKSSGGSKASPSKSSSGGARKSTSGAKKKK